MTHMDGYIAGFSKNEAEVSKMKFLIASKLENGERIFATCFVGTEPEDWGHVFIDHVIDNSGRLYRGTLTKNEETAIREKAILRLDNAKYQKFKDDEYR
jgi:hypothetical protein